ncbi:zinc metalloprotease-like protein [Sporormia fimetaria CBS 119925]|uniref:Zinc metalloprotease-like protein n=1 Tax=Sporormia fimetaria CBS 119925 TaxID=1340428 RepID=A0A6A6VFT6_9PLEO|nr:zinc metalloprotease-like protein [Sporormia fimetaria CBS 119925]
MGSLDRPSHFKVIQKFTPDYADARITHYESQRTGMRVVVVDRKGPKVYGYFSVATEIHDDSGAPHTLEHLVFMGSKRFPYKSVLDRAATRSYADTNAWTDNHETVYSLTAAGWEGFAQLLPMYLDHVIQPTLTDEACYTEVHHVDGTGHDAGVVYSEMQGRENLQSDLMDLQMRHHLYPEGDGFRYETGGLTPNLRVLTADRIRQFHKDMYQPKNLRVVLIGEVDHENLLDLLDKLEDDYVDRVPAYDAPFKRPWVDSAHTPPLKDTVVDTVEFPEEDESTGEIQIAFLGPEARDDLAETALNTILTYLAGSSVSVLVNTLVEKEHVTSMVYFWIKSHFHQVIWFVLTSVATEKLADVEKRFFEVLREHLEKPLDMGYLTECLHRFKRQVKLTSEMSNDDWKEPILKDHLFGARDGSDLYHSLSSLKDFEELEKWSEADWRAFANKWLVENNHVSILGKPSKALAEKIKSDEAARIKAQQEKLGEDGLKKLAQKLEDAKAQNDKPIPEGMISDLKVPGAESIHLFKTVTARSGLAKSLGVTPSDVQNIVDKDENGFPLFIHYEHFSSSFVHFGIALGTAGIPTELKPLLGVYLGNFFATPIMKDGQRIEFEKVIVDLERDTVEYSFDRAADLGNSEMVYIYFVAEADKFETIVKWLATLFVDSIFDKDRLISIVKRMLADVPDEKRDGNSMAYSVDRMIHFNADSTVRATNTLVKAVYLRKILQLLKNTPEQVIEELHELVKHLLTFSNMRVLTIADLTKLQNPVSTFKHITDKIQSRDTTHINPIDDRKALLSDLGRKPGNTAYMIPMPIDSSFAIFTTQGIDSYTSPRLPALMVAQAYLDAIEGPMWISVRGTGLAYGSNFMRDLGTGLFRFSIYRSPNPFAAYKVAKNVVEGYVNGTTPFEKLALEGAISSIVREFVDDKATIMDAAKGAFADQVVRGLEKGYPDWMLAEVRKVTEEDVKNVMRDVVLKVFDPQQADLIVTCGGDKIEGMMKEWEKEGFKPQSKTLSDFQDGYGMEGGVEGEGAFDEDLDSEEESGSEEESEEE